MKYKYTLGVLFIVLITFLLFPGENNNTEVTHVNILNLPVSLVSDRELNSLANQSAEGYGQVKIKISENGTFNVNRIILLRKAGIVYIPVLYSPNIRFNDISIENAKLLNSSILVSGRGSVLLLKLKVAKGSKASISFKYQSSIEEQTCAGIFGTLFVNCEGYNEVEMPPEVFLPEISAGVLRTKIILDLPHSWGNWTGI
ncbi:hypothetical protein, partial [Thermococcus sp.]